MGQRKCKFVLVTLLVAFGLLFAGGEALAAFSYQLQNTGSTNSATSASYIYTVTIAPGSNPATFIEFAIPVGICIKEGVFSGGSATGCTAISPGTAGYSSTGTFTISASGGATITSGEVFGAAVGDYGSKFGYGDGSIRVLKANFGTVPLSGSFTVTLGFSGQAFVPSGTTPYVFGTDPGGAALLKASQGTNTLSFITKTPDVVLKPADPTSAVTNLSVTPNPIVPPSTSANVSWDGSNSVQIAGLGTIQMTGPNSATITPPPNQTSDPIVYMYTISSTCAGCASETFTITVNPIPGATTVILSATPDTLISGQKPLCTNLHWEAPGSTVAISSVTPPSTEVVPVASGLGPIGNMSVCPESTTVYTATASNAGPGGSNAKTVTVDVPSLQTSCTQIVKNAGKANATCLHVCFEIGGNQDMVSADLYRNADCSGDVFEPLAIYSPDSPDLSLRKSALICAPCGDTGAPACSGNPPASGPPFDVSFTDGSLTYSVKCEKFVKEVEPKGVTLDLGEDPCIVVNKKLSCY